MALWHKIAPEEDPEWTRRYHSLDIAEKAFGGSVTITLTDGTVIEESIAVADAHPLGARPFGRGQYIAKFRTLAAESVAPEEIERFLDTVQRLPELGPGELDALNILAEDGVIDLATTPEQKRIRLREALASGRIQQFPGAFSPLSARLIEEKGFPGVCISGAVLANDLGLPDIGLTTLTEVATRAGQIARMTGLPAIVDADTGFGEPMNVARTVQELENAGLAGCHIEDQVNPKRCGHLDGKAVVDLDTALKRIRAAADARRDPSFLIMARTDIRAADTGPAGLEAAAERAKAFVEAGADAIFPEAMGTLEEFKAIRDAVDVPVLANMTEFGKSRLFTTDELQNVGINLVIYPVTIYPVTLLRSAMGEAERTLETIRSLGTQESKVQRMLTRSRLYELLDYETYNRLDTGIFDFQIPGRY